MYLLLTMEPVEGRGGSGCQNREGVQCFTCKEKSNLFFAKQMGDCNYQKRTLTKDRIHQIYIYKEKKTVGNYKRSKLFEPPELCQESKRAANTRGLPSLKWMQYGCFFDPSFFHSQNLPKKQKQNLTVSFVIRLPTLYCTLIKRHGQYADSNITFTQ